LTPELTTGGATITAAAGGAAALGAVAVYSPKDAIFALLAAAFVAVAISRLSLAIAILIVLTFPAHLPGSFGAGATLAKPVGALIVVAWGGAVLTRRGNLPVLPRERPLLFSLITGLLLLGLLSMLWAADPGQTRSTLGRLLQVAALLIVTYTAASSRAGFRTVVRGYLLASVVTALYTTASGNYNPASGRLSGVITPDYFAAELIPAILIACFLMVTASSLRTRWLFGAICCIDLIAFVLTQSRGAIVGLAVALPVAVLLAGRARPRILVLVLVLVAGGVGYYFGYKPAHVFGGGSRGGLSATSSGRLDEWRVAFRVAAGHPIGGVGLGNYQTVEGSYATQTLNLDFVGYIVKDRLVAHNTYLQVAAELGFLGLLLFLMILLLPLRLAGRTLARLERALDGLEFHVRGLLAGTIGLLVAYVFLSAELEKPLWLLLALLASVPALAHDTTETGALNA
jgi:O-antigen ligase